MLTLTFEERIIEIERLIRSAKAGEAQSRITAIKNKQIPAESRYTLANLATRAGMPKHALSLLRRIVHPPPKEMKRATTPELAEYAIALIRLGADSEAQTLLNKTSTSEYPKALSYKAILAMKQWKYTDAVPLLSEYLSKEPDEYFHANGMSNLIQSLIFLGRFQEAQPLMANLLQYAQSKSMRIHEANVLSYSGMIEFLEGKHSEAIKHFKQAAEVIGTTQSLDYFFIRKWIAITEAFKTKGNPSSLEKLVEMRNEAIERRHWETVRDIDYHQAVLFQDHELFTRLYFGTPYSGFRKRLVARFPNVAIEEPYTWNLGKKPKGLRQVLDLIGDEDDALKAGQAMHRLYTVLLSDHYRPFGQATLFDKIFPGEFYNEAMARQRVFQVIKRLRQHFKKAKVPLLIEEVEGEYRLSSNKPVAVLIREQSRASRLSAKEHRLNSIREKVGEEFTVVSSMKILRLSRTAVTIMVEEALRTGIIEKIGEGRQTRYRFTNELYKMAS